MSDADDQLELVRLQEEKQTERLKIWQNIVLLGVLALIFGVIFYGLFDGGSRLLYSLRETEVSRGLITFVLSITTVSIALLVAVYVMASNEKAEALKERFAYAKDVLSTLVGIFGTVLGFYFGTSMAGSTDSLEVSAPQVRAGELVAHIRGGTPPYRYVLAGPGEDKAKPATKDAKDGWLFEPVRPGWKAEDALVLEVFDAKDRKLSKSFKLTPEPAAAGSAGKSPSAAPSASAASR